MEVKPGYKQTEVGVIPEEWETHRLGELLQGPRSIRYGIVQPGKFEVTGCFMLRSQDYSKGWAGPDGMHKVSAQLENQYRNARIHRNDLVITVVGAGIGQVVVVPDWLDGAILSRSTARIAIDEEKAAPSFVRAFLEGPLGKRQILDCQKEGAQPVVSCLDLAKFFVAYPPLPEQRAIAEALSDVDGLLGGLDRLIAKKRDLKQAAMQQLLTGQTRLPGFHGEWEAVTMRQVLTQNATYGIVTAGSFVPDGVKMLRGGDIADGRVNTDLPMVTRDKAAEYDRTALVKNDVVIALVGYPGASAKIPDELIGANISRAVGLLRMNGKVSAHFLVCFLNSPDGRRMVLAPSAGSAQQVVNLAALNKLQFSVPSLAEQTAIAEVLSEMDGELAVLEQRREKTRALKQAMMQELLTGRTRLV